MNFNEIKEEQERTLRDTRAVIAEVNRQAFWITLKRRLKAGFWLLVIGVGLFFYF